MSIVSRNSNECRSHTEKTKAEEKFDKFISDKDYDEKLLLPFEAFLNASFCKYLNKVEAVKLTLSIAAEDCAVRSLVKPEPAQRDAREMQTGEWEKSDEKADGSCNDSDNAAIAGKSQYKIAKEKNIEKIKQRLAKLEEQYPLPREFAQKKALKVPAVKKGKQGQNETAVRRESQRSKDKITYVV